MLIAEDQWMLRMALVILALKEKANRPERFQPIVLVASSLQRVVLPTMILVKMPVWVTFWKHLNLSQKPAV